MYCKQIPEGHITIKENDPEQSFRIVNSVDNFPVVTLL